MDLNVSYFYYLPFEFFVVLHDMYLAIVYEKRERELNNFSAIYNNINRHGNELQIHFYELLQDDTKWH